MEASKSSPPASVVSFELLGVVSLAFDMVFGMGVGWFSVFWFPLMLGLIFGVSRGRSGGARWAFTIIFAFGGALMLYFFATGLLMPTDMFTSGWIMTAASIAQLWLLWSPATSDWIAGGRNRADVERVA